MGTAVPAARCLVITEERYEAVAPPLLRALVDALDAVETDGLEAELESDIVTIELSDGARYVVNSHRAARQIWMAAERSAWHFDYEESSGRWLDSKTGDELWDVLERVLSAKTGSPVTLRRS